MGESNKVGWCPNAYDSIATFLTANAATKDGRDYRVLEGMSSEMKALNDSFKRDHAMAIHLNAISMLATVFYGLWLSSRLRL